MIVTAITGASGSILGIRLIEELLNSGERVVAIVSETAWRIIGCEVSHNKENYTSLKELLMYRGVAQGLDHFHEYDNKDLFSPVASGSTSFEAMVVIPCSMKTLASISHGYADSLISRACDVAIKEKRRCIIVPRETPMSIIHLENMYKAGLAGVDVVPPVPGFYTHPRSIDDVIDFVIGRILNLLGKEHALFKSWGNVGLS
ncbi:MAG: UbiX family flavin prenyltransferase [Spirochaetota bacterium]|nr:UbiX family flavin prenyltransferase [Spirochaetota bacterium]